MEFLKTCNTNAQAIGDFEAVAFQAFSVARSPAHPPRAFDHSPSDDIRAAEAELRREQHLVIQDGSRPWLWLFRAATADQANQKPLDLPAVDGFRFQREQYGLVKASELSRPPMRSANPNLTPSGSMSSPLTSVPPKGLQAGGSRPSQGSSQFGSIQDQQQQCDSFAIYELFVSSVVALISYCLVKDHQAIALNYRTFFSKPVVQHDPHAGTHSSLPAVPYWLTNIDVFWASSGTLVVSTFSLTQPEVICLDDMITDEQEKHMVGKCVRVAPSGLLAQVVSFDEPLDVATEEINQRPQRKRARIPPFEQGLERWKSAVKTWLSWKGFSIPFLEKGSSWVKIRIGHLNQHGIRSPIPSNSVKEMLWPRSLCFYYDSSAALDQVISLHPTTSASADSVQSWFETPATTGFTDPVDAAQQWFMGKPERDRVVEARRRAKKAEEDAARIKEESHGLFPSSPLNARGANYGDLQAVSGVYPTPPDGVPPGTAVSSGDTPSVSGAANNVILASGGTNPVINLLAPQETVRTDGQLHPLTSPEVSLPYDQYHSGGGNDDLFEDMDEDGFDGNGVTDADFNFFDDPDAEDMDMLDVPAVEDVKPSTKIEKEKDVTLPGSDIKEEPADPMAALETALATASRQVEEDSRGISSQQQISQETDSIQDQATSPSGHPIVLKAEAILSIPKEPTPPLSPRFIENALLPSPKDKLPFHTPKKQMSSHQRDSVFDPLSFSRKMSLSDAKYQDGRFNLPVELAREQNEDTKPASRPKSLRDLPLLTRLRYAIGVASTNGIPEVASLADADSDLSDTSSEISSLIDDDEVIESYSVGPSPLPTGLIMPIKRKLPTEGNATPLSATSFADSFGGELLDMASLQTDESALALLEPTAWDWPLVNLPPPSEHGATTIRYSVPAFSPLLSSTPSTPVSQPDISMDMLEDKPISGKESIAVAQVVTDQIVSATLDLLYEDPSLETEIIFNRTPSESKWKGAIQTIFPKSTDCSVAALASVQDVFPDLPVPAKGQQRPPPRKPNEGGATLGHHLHQINAPYIRVRRADTLWDLLPPALAFWEPLGISPCSPAKNVVAFSIYPHSESLRHCVENFMVNIQLAYDGCRLGSHSRAETVPEYEGGLIPCIIKTAVCKRAAFKALRDTCIQLGKLLAAKHMQMRGKEDSKIDAFVIYMMDPFEHPSAIWELCSAFWSLFQAYGQGPGRPEQLQKPDVVLQIVPMKYVASFEAPVILDSSTYASLAREVYDRCPPSAPSEDKTPLSIYTAPSFQLEEPIPRNIPFKLNAEPPQDLLHENSYIHIGYAISLDGAWITAAWTDTCGKSQTVVSYNLGTRAFGEIAKEIWQTTVDILQARRVTWRVCIAKAGVMDREEMEAWVFLVSCPTQLNLFITLLTVDTEPHLKFTPTMPANSTVNSATAGHPAANTPGSTPQGGVSPEHGLTPAATPSAENTTDPTADPDARLLDATDETWGIILAHRLHNSNSTNEYRPALISGLLVKRGLTTTKSPPVPGTPDPERGPIIVAVNILWMGAVNPTRAATSPFPPAGAPEGISPGGGVPPSPQERGLSSLTWTPTVQTRAAAENLLKEVLGQFRGLGLLARLKGIRGSRHGTVPWHIAASIRGVRGLGLCLPQ